MVFNGVDGFIITSYFILFLASQEVLLNAT